MSQLFELPRTICPQGTDSKTFTPPPFNDFLPVEEIIDWHAAHSKYHPVFVYFDEASGSNVNVVWKDFAQAIYRIAHLVSSSLGASKDTTNPLIGLYSSSDALTYILALLGVWRAGFPVFLISPRASPVALKHLIVKSGVTHILVNDDDKKLLEGLQSVREDPAVNITVSYIPSSKRLFAAEYSVEKPPIKKSAWESISLILHSSGSTALPELNPWTHRMIYNSIWHTWYGERDICGEVWSTPSAPMALATGVMQAVFVLSSGVIISGFKPTSPPTLPNPDNVWKSMIATKSTYCLILPPFLRLWAEDPEKVQKLAALEGVMFGGGPLPKEFGDKLAQAGVTLYTLYGMSETGMLNRAFTKKPGMDWEWFSFHPLLSPGFRYEPTETEGTAELVIKNCPTHTPTKTNREFDNVPALATGDLIRSHPTKPGLWKYHCRISDQETVGPGEKINAVALARVLMSDPLIAGAVIFTYIEKGVIVVGAIIEPVGTYAGDLTKQAEVSVYKNLVWPTFERYNAIAPVPARLAKGKILIASRENPFTYSEKAMPRRKEAIAAYQVEIQGLMGNTE